MTKLMSKSRAEKDVLDSATTRTRLELMWGTAFDPEAMAPRLHPAETARFIADQMRKLRLAALRSSHSALLWMIESANYEAYAQDCSKHRLEP